MTGSLAGIITRQPLKGLLITVNIHTLCKDPVAVNEPDNPLASETLPPASGPVFAESDQVKSGELKSKNNIRI